MQISDMLGQYNRNVTNGTEELHGAQSVQKLVSTIGEMSAGSVFEGTVNYVKGGKVSLALGNGQVISARLEGKVDIRAGSSMFFQVKANDGETVSIKPYTGAGSTGNPILTNALTAAGVPVTDRSLAMVDAMMKEQMSIGRQSILDMVKILNNNPGANVETVVSMTKLGIPVTEAMAVQFEHYLSDSHAILNEMEQAVGQLAEVLGSENLSAEDAFALYSRILDIFVKGGEGSAQPGMGQDGAGAAAQPETGQEAAAVQPKITEGLIEAEDNITENAKGMVSEAGNSSKAVGAENAAETVKASAENAAETVKASAESAVESQLAGNKSAVQSGLPEDVANTAAQGTAAGEQGAAQTTGTVLGELLSEEQLALLTKQLQHIPTLAGNPELFSQPGSEEIYVDTMQEELGGQEVLSAKSSELVFGEAVINKDMTSGEFLQALQKALGENSKYGFGGLSKLLAGKEFQTLLKDMIEQQWLIKPQDLKQENKISSLYERMGQQIGQMESAMKAAGMTQNSFLQTASDIRGNIEFMNQMNQMYTYVQMPLKLSGQSANGELYVYTNKKKFGDPEAELTAFLHLDLENLGTTDVSVRMRNRKVHTNFYLPDDKAYELVEKHLPILEMRLKNKGYSCTVTLTHENKDVNFAENLFKKEQMSAGSLHRYSFDVRA